jgi:hypothetical protein
MTGPSILANPAVPRAALDCHVSVRGHAWRIGMLVAIGTLVSAGVAFVSA